MHYKGVQHYGNRFVGSVQTMVVTPRLFVSTDLLESKIASYAILKSGF